MDKRAFDLIKKIKLVEQELSSFIVEKEDVLRLILIAILSKKNLFILGNPGESKSYAVTQFSNRITNIKYFETLMHKLKDVSEIFGQLDVLALKQGVQSILTTNMATEANINFLDELFKSSDACLNTILKLLNFEKIQLQGQVFEPPTLCTFSASNEIPDFQDESNAILKPLYDRLHLKIVTAGIKDPINYTKALTAKRNGLDKVINHTIDLQELMDLQEYTKKVIVPSEADEKFWEICQVIKERLKLNISDRKKIEYSTIVQANALLNNRDTVDIEQDFPILKYYLWESENEIDSINKIILELIENPLEGVLESFNNMIVDCRNSFIKSIEDEADSKIVRISHRKFSDELANIYYQISQLKTGLPKDNVSNLQSVDKVLDFIEKINEDIINGYVSQYGIKFIPIAALASYF